MTGFALLRNLGPLPVTLSRHLVTLKHERIWARNAAMMRRQKDSYLSGETNKGDI